VNTVLKRVHGYLAEFDSASALYKAAQKTRENGYKIWDVHSPYPIHGMDGAMGLGRSKLPFFVFFGGLAGITTAFLLAYITQVVIYPTVVQAKPTNINTIAAFFPPMFELTILFSAFTVLFVGMAFMRLPRWHHPLFASRQFARFSDDAFFLVIEARDPQFSREKTAEFLGSIGGRNLELVEDEL
jgi:hypothetical protein